jgi:hypothetical protein
MASEPERKIEELLRAYAQKRREEAGDRFELHPATRRLLQGEVTRTFPQKEETASWLLLLRGMWLRAGLAVSILLVLGVAVWLIHPWEKQPDQFAAAPMKPPPPPPVVNSPLPAVAPTEPVRGLSAVSPDSDPARLREKTASADEKKEAASTWTRADEAPKAPAQKSISRGELALEERAGTTKDSLAKGMAKAAPSRSAGRTVVNGQAKAYGG